MRIEKAKYKGFSEDEIKDMLKDEGFERIYTWEDLPGNYYPEHAHNFYSAHVVIHGKIKIKTRDGEEIFFEEGDRFDIHSGELHSAKVGPEGCRYIVAEK